MGSVHCVYLSCQYRKVRRMKKIWSMAVNQWNEFFFKPISPATIAMFRIVFSFVVFLSMAGKFPFRDIFYGVHGIVSEATVDRYFTGNPILYFRWVPGSDPALMFYFVGILLSTLSLMVGFCTRISSILVFLALISLSNRNFFVDNSVTISCASMLSF